MLMFTCISAVYMLFQKLLYNDVFVIIPYSHICIASIVYCKIHESYYTLPGELLKLWSGQQKEREKTLHVYHEQLYQELEVLEKDVTVTRNSEEQTTTLLKKQLKTLKQSLGTQQRQ